ncbi:hypothetical protein HG537_0A08140 [Torulaspora globosa]|uniref:Altered inheritance of mitochondria protein 23, mitochondrial n=1 Tax=Torulaspora globosa TaxID=48254 RepID=A0A7H9HPM5_9SACH|nr:hypothetical protein HG537_0A08140 [Torulaspora sp. CBS 2947]
MLMPYQAIWLWLMVKRSEWLFNCCYMWSSVTRRAYVPVISRWKGFHTSLAHSDWMLSNDIIRNALATEKPVGPSGGNQNRGPLKKMTKNRPVNKNKAHSRNNLAIIWKSGSDRDKEAANAVISQIFRMNKAGTIKVVNSTTSKLEGTNIRSFAKGINLEENGLVIVNFEEIDETTKVPLVKLVDRKTALKRFSDEKARQKEQEMISRGLVKRKPARSSDGEKADDSIKQIKISWQIKDDDLNKQKAHEITSQLKKGYKVYLYIDDKNHINSKNWATEFDAPVRKNAQRELSAKELNQRNSILQQLEKIVDEFSNQPTIEGTVETKVLMKLTPKHATTEPNSKQSLKEQRKKERQEKLQQRIQKKMQRILEKESGD